VAPPSFLGAFDVPDVFEFPVGTLGLPFAGRSAEDGGRGTMTKAFVLGT
jgi:hypothetical protein